MSWLLLALFACDRGDPELRPYREALTLWEQGVAHLEAGDADAASEAFAEAGDRHPGDPVLAAWEARALADAGRTREAIEVLDATLLVHPRFAEARYNRAAYRARVGDASGAASDLARALEQGARPPREVLGDPDFAPYLEHPAFAFLPDARIEVHVQAPEEPVFWGSEFTLRFQVVGAGDGPIGVSAERADGPAELVGVVEDTVASTEGAFRDVTWRLVPLGAGEIALGPFHVWAGERRITVPPVTVTAAAPPGREEPSRPLREIRFATPRELASGGEAPSARVVDGDLVVLLGPADRLEVSPAPDADAVVTYELRDGGAPRFTLKRFPGAASRERSVRILRRGAEVFSERLGG